MIDNKIISKIGLISCIIAILLISLGISYAQSSKKIVLNLNYKNTQSGESLSLANAYVIDGSAPDYSSQPKEGYRLEIVSLNKQVLKKIIFVVPTGSLDMPGFAGQHIEGTADDLRFSIDIPYFPDAEIINIYDKNNVKVLGIPIESFYSGGKNKITFEASGYFEVIFIDDFDHPENSRTETYLDVEGKKYALKVLNPTDARPGDYVKVKGLMVGDTIVAESIEKTNEPQETMPSETNAGQEIAQKNKPNISWVYVALPIIVILGFLVNVEVKRKKENRLLMQKKKGQNIDAMRKYINDNLQRGFSKDKIKSALSKNNYSNDEIE